jgi:hypothetical protein
MPGASILIAEQSWLARIIRTATRANTGSMAAMNSLIWVAP